MSAAAVFGSQLVPSGRPVIVVDDSKFEYLDQQHLPEAERSVVSVADVLASGPCPVQYPPEAIAPPTWDRWEFEHEGRRHVSPAPLARFFYWAATARRHIRTTHDMSFAEGFAHGWHCHGSRRTKR
jgi:hypothetical protein